MKRLYNKKFSAKETQQLILDGWIVEGDRQNAYRNNVRLDPATYRAQQEQKFSLLKE